MNELQRKKLVEQKIQILIQEFQNNPEKFLTEEDIKSYLYHLLLNDFNKIEETEDNSKSIPLHCEVRWYGLNKNLKYRSDIVIFDVFKLKTKPQSVLLPSKGYGFGNPHIIIEIKLRRINGKSNNQFYLDLEKDRLRLIEIKSKVTDSEKNVYTYLLGFDKKSNIGFKINNSKDHQEYYVFSRVD